ncbi:uncharacterized protein ACRADG_010007 [Cochliomyia hominivorax]
MFIKIKLEPQSLKALSPLKKISYFAIDDNATIINLKMKIEEYVDVPAERQEIRTLTKVFQNGWLVKEVCDIRGSAIMLYAYNECYEYEDPQFVCFLQVYTNELAAQQQELEELLKSSIASGKITTTNSTTSSVTLIADSDTEADSDGTCAETVSSKSSGSDDSESEGNTDSSDSSCGKKRSKHNKKNIFQNKKLKVTAPSGNQFSEKLCQYLEEFPKCSKQLNVTDNKVSTVQSVTVRQVSSEGLTEENISNDTLSDHTTLNMDPTNEKQNNNPENLTSKESFETNSTKCNSNKIQSNKITTTNNNKSNNNNNKSSHPCYFINPEIRDCLAIITPKDISEVINPTECEKLLVWFFDRFRACDLSSNLQFDNKSSLFLFEGKLWIACMNNNTFQWVSSNIIEYPTNSYKILPLKDTKHLCEVVIPIISNSKSVLDIFDLLEKQNKSINTLKWSLQNRQVLTVEQKNFNEKIISNFCTNELFNICMDIESKENLEKLNFKLNYCFWQILFKFI